MSNRYGHRDRGVKDKKSKTSTKKQKAMKKCFKHHPLFGDIPVIKIRNTFNQEYWDYDPDYKPLLPRGAVRGNIKSQSFCRMCHVPRYFYINQDKICVQCGKDFVFSAREQKYWYESLKFHFDSTAIRCPKCRRTQRTVKALNRQLEQTKSKLRKEPNDPLLLLSLAQTILAFHKKTNFGNLDEAIASCRQSIKLWPEAFEAIYWEGMCHFEAGRYRKANSLFANFIKIVGGKGKYKALRRKAESLIETMKGQRPSADA